MEKENNTNLLQESQETSIILRGEKIKMSKAIIIGWVLVVALLISCASLFISGWMRYKQYQGKCLEAMIIVYSSFNRPTPNEDEMLESCRRDLSPDRVADLRSMAYLIAAQFGAEPNYSEAEYAEALQSTAKVAFEAIGYPPEWEMAYVFKYEGWAQYAKGVYAGLNKNGVLQSISVINITLLSLTSFVFLLVAITQIIYNSHKKQTITLDEKNIYCSTGKKKIIDIPFTRIQSIKRGPYRGIIIKTPSTRISISLLRNQIEILNYLTDKMHEIHQ